MRCAFGLAASVVLIARVVVGEEKSSRCVWGGYPFEALAPRCLVDFSYMVSSVWDKSIVVFYEEEGGERGIESRYNATFSWRNNKLVPDNSF